MRSPEFFFVARWGDIEKRDNEEKKLERKDWCIGESTTKKAKEEEEEEEKEATETRKDKALGERARRKKER